MSYKLKKLSEIVFEKKVPLHLLLRGGNFGECPICNKGTLFYKEGKSLREQYRCLHCYSIPRFRAIISVIESEFPSWREMKIHESSGAGPASWKLAKECKNYIGSQYFPEQPFGSQVEKWRNENLEQQTFEDNTFDLVVTQDVLEHIFDAEKVFAEICRSLKPGGAHVFTVPWYHWKETLLRAKIERDEVVFLEEPDYHGNPVDPNGSLVVREWGKDLCETIDQITGMKTSVIKLNDRTRGIAGEFIEVFISRKKEVFD